MTTSKITPEIVAQVQQFVELPRSLKVEVVETYDKKAASMTNTELAESFAVRLVSDK